MKKFNVMKALKIEYLNNDPINFKVRTKETTKQKAAKKNYLEYLEVKNALKNIPYNTTNKTLLNTRVNLRGFVQNFKSDNYKNPIEIALKVSFSKHEDTLYFNNFNTLKEKKERLLTFANKSLIVVREERAARKINHMPKRVSDVYPQFLNHSFGKLHFKAIGNNNIGYVHLDKNDFKRYEKASSINKIFKAKKPLTSENHIGIEIEMFTTAPQTLIAEKLVDINKYLHLKSDSSIQPEGGGAGHELVICVPESKREEVVKKVSKVLKELNCKVNNSCGLHVHLDMRTRDRKTSFSNLVSAQNVLYMMNPKSRNNGKYCRTTPNKDFETALVENERYCGINALAFNKHKTIEVRIHSGTIDDTKINNWVNILEKIISCKEQYSRSTSELKLFSKRFDLEPETCSYIEERIKLFNSEHNAA